MTKADQARALLKQGWPVADVARKVPMAYSQAHSIAQKMGTRPESKRDLLRKADRSPVRAGMPKEQPHDHPFPGLLDAQGNCPGCANYNRESALKKAGIPSGPRGEINRMRRGTHDDTIETVKAIHRQQRKLRAAEKHRPAVSRGLNEKLKAAQAESRRGKPKQLKSGPLPKDTEVGSCANCGHDLVIRPMTGFFLLVHTNASAEEYLRTIQFCHAVPERLLPARAR